MEGVITIQDSREHLTEMQQWRLNEAMKVNKNLKAEKTIDTIVDVAKTVVSVAGTVATVAMMICPLDGPAGELATMAATPGLVNAVESSRTLLKGIFVTKNTDEIRAAISDVAQNVKNISIKDRNLVQNQPVNMNNLTENVEMTK